MHSLGPHWYLAVSAAAASLWGAGRRDLLCCNSHPLLALCPQGEGEAYMGRVCVGGGGGGRGRMVHVHFECVLQVGTSLLALSLLKLTLGS